MQCLSETEKRIEVDLMYKQYDPKVTATKESRYIVKKLAYLGRKAATMPGGALSTTTLHCRARPGDSSVVREGGW